MGEGQPSKVQTTRMHETSAAQRLGLRGTVITFGVSDGLSVVGLVPTIMAQSQSNAATLGGLTLSDIDSGTFASGTTTHAASAANRVRETTVTPTVNHSGDSYVAKLGGVEDADGVASLSVGSNVITVEVTAEDHRDILRDGDPRREHARDRHADHKRHGRSGRNADGGAILNYRFSGRSRYRRQWVKPALHGSVPEGLRSLLFLRPVMSLWRRNPCRLQVPPGPGGSVSRSTGTSPKTSFWEIREEMASGRRRMRYHNRCLSSS